MLVKAAGSSTPVRPPFGDRLRSGSDTSNQNRCQTERSKRYEKTSEKAQYRIADCRPVRQGRCRVLAIERDSANCAKDADNDTCHRRANQCLALFPRKVYLGSRSYQVNQVVNCQWAASGRLHTYCNVRHRPGAAFPHILLEVVFARFEFLLHETFFLQMLL